MEIQKGEVWGITRAGKLQKVSQLSLLKPGAVVLRNCAVSCVDQPECGGQGSKELSP